jgi:peptidyl-prolyl cis-trans isomerase C
LKRASNTIIVPQQDGMPIHPAAPWMADSILLPDFSGNKLAGGGVAVHSTGSASNRFGKVDSMKIWKFLTLLAVSTPLAVSSLPAAAEDKVIVIINGHEIKTSEVEIAAEDIAMQLGDLPAKLRYPFLIEYLVERHLLAQAAVKQGVADSEEYKKRLAFYQAKALRDAYFNDSIKPSVTDEEVKTAYEKEASKIKIAERVRARHILVQTEKEAKDVLARLSKGEKFEDIAKQVSLDGSKDYGGDLGYFSAEEMVPEFSKAAFALKVGDISAPIKTDYGWHVIKLEDRKQGGAQPFDQVKAGIKAVLMRKKVQDTVTELRKEAKIEIIDPDLKKLQEMGEKRMEDLKKKGTAAPANAQPAAGAEPAADGKQDLQTQQ